MKKILIASSVILLLAAGCSATQQASVTTTPQNTTADSAITPSPSAVATQAVVATPTPTAMATKTPSPTPTKAPVVVTVALKLGTSASLGQYLTASNGMTLYTYGSDSANVSNCSGSCAANWPPYTQSAGLQLGAVSGISGKLGTITRADGTTQVTYKGMPLYFWVNDTKPGDTTGQGLGGFVVAKP